MSNTRAGYHAVQRGLGAFVLMLFVLLDWAAEQTSIAAHDPGSLVRRWLGLTTIALITVIGRTVDSLPLEFLVAARGKAQPNKPAHLARPQRLR